MAAIDHDMGKPAKVRGFHARLMRRIASPSFQSWAAAFPLTRRVARKDAEQLFDLVSGFAYSQVLQAVVELGLLRFLQNGPRSIGDIARATELSSEKAVILCQAASALGLISRRGEDEYRIARLGAAALGVPGLEEMIRHHSVFYRDLTDPVALLRGETSPELAEFWPYVRGETARDVSEDVAGTYSDLMAQSQGLVAEETLKSVDLGSVTRLMDVGGGTGAFLRAVRAKYAQLDLTLFDLPSVVAQVPRENAARLDVEGGSFHEALPEGADAISLIRVLYDHSDETVTALLARVFEALPVGGMLLISEPMSGGAKPTRAGDVYFALYTMAMTTGRARSADQIAHMVANAGFGEIKKIRSDRPFLTSCLTARKPG